MGGEQKDILNGRQLRFCEEYAITGNGTQSAIIAGYSESTAGSQASTLLTLPKIQEKVAHVKSLLAKKTGLNAEDLIEEHKSVGFANLADYFKEDMTLEAFKALPRHIMAAVKSVEVTELRLGETEGVKMVTKFQLHDKFRHLDALGKNFGIYEEHNRQKNNVLDLTTLTDEELHTLLTLQEKAKGGKNT